ncbi:hypothetical protein OESDEN_19557 [Oesophagostomum dentatum]|uniref:Uncharacterized protein n=1 Tax=Oesophagostomum dentatum TaxID=61180 RepID=A0A0B1S749_OESDE|nr:hypothetical protein OESDEN_19557 [Oesophagostomum dentatum]
MKSITVATFILSLLVLNSMGLETRYGKYGPMRLAGDEQVINSYTPIKYRRASIDAYGDFSSMMRSMDELQRPRFGRK